MTSAIDDMVAVVLTENERRFSDKSRVQQMIEDMQERFLSAWTVLRCSHHIMFSRGGSKFSARPMEKIEDGIFLPTHKQKHAGVRVLYRQDQHLFRIIDDADPGGASGMVPHTQEHLTEQSAWAGFIDRVYTAGMYLVDKSVSGSPVARVWGAGGAADEAAAAAPGGGGGGGTASDGAVAYGGATVAQMQPVAGFDFDDHKANKPSVAAKPSALFHFSEAAKARCPWLSHIDDRGRFRFCVVPPFPSAAVEQAIVAVVKTELEAAGLRLYNDFIDSTGTIYGSVELRKPQEGPPLKAPLANPDKLLGLHTAWGMAKESPDYNKDAFSYVQGWLEKAQAAAKRQTDDSPGSPEAGLNPTDL